MLIYIPNKAMHPVPSIIGINFVGNQAIHADPSIKLTEAWTENSKMFPCAGVLSNESGAGGGKQFRRGIGENITRLNTAFPHWYAKSFRKYMDKDEQLPFDQHYVMALIAPRPVYLGTAQEDKMADPEGEFETAKASDAVYKFLGTKGFPFTTFPALNEPLFGRIGFHIRPGGHDVQNCDWKQYLNFSNLQFSVFE